MTTPYQPSIRMNPLLPIDPPEGRTLYYLKTTLPSWHDIAISGPFHCLEAVFPNLCVRLADTKACEAAFEKHTQDGRLINQFLRLSAPLTSDPTKTIVIELLRMENPSMAARLPGPAWNVTYGEFLGLDEERGEPLASGVMGAAATKELDILGSFASEAEAERSARRVLRERVDRDGGVQVAILRTEGRRFCGGMVRKGES